LDVRGEGNAVNFDNEISVEAEAKVNKWVLTAGLDSLTITKLVAHDSKVSGKIDTQGLQTTFNFLLKVANPLINEKILNTGIDLPDIKHVNLKDSKVVTENQYLDIEATPSFDFEDAMFNPVDYGSNTDSNI